MIGFIGLPVSIALYWLMLRPKKGCSIPQKRAFTSGDRCSDQCDHRHPLAEERDFGHPDPTDIIRLRV